MGSRHRTDGTKETGELHRLVAGVPPNRPALMPRSSRSGSPLPFPLGARSQPAFSGRTKSAVVGKAVVGYRKEVRFPSTIQLTGFSHQYSLPRRVGSRVAILKPTRPVY